ncbi:hypothetical protein D3C72_1772320 [compost metagenome]
MAAAGADVSQQVRRRKLLQRQADRQQQQRGQRQGLDRLSGCTPPSKAVEDRPRRFTRQIAQRRHAALQTLDSLQMLRVGVEPVTKGIALGSADFTLQAHQPFGRLLQHLCRR